MPDSETLPHAAEALAQELLCKPRLEPGNLLELFELLPGEPFPRGKPSPSSKSFSSGAFIHGGVCGLRSSTKLYSSCAKVFATYVKQVAPAHHFTSITLCRNCKAELHCDSHNSPSHPNCVIALSSFSHGEIWFEDLNGSVAIADGSKQLVGRLLPLPLGRPTFLDARHCRHQTQPWKGVRCVLIAFSIRDSQKLSQEDRHFLESCLFSLPGRDTPSPRGLGSLSPSGSSCGLGTSPPKPQSQASARPLFYELFAGSAKLSLAARQAGFGVVAIDHSYNKHVPCVPLCLLDLTSQAAQQCLMSRWDSAPPAFVHIGLPCGTSSLAREKPIAAHLRAAGAPTPQPLRSVAFPLGLPHLRGASLTKVQHANVLAEFAVKIMHRCWQDSIPFSLENPARAHTWRLLRVFVLRYKCQAFLLWFDELRMVIFSSCMHGGLRNKRTGLLTSAAQLKPLEVACSQDHVHAPWSVSFSASGWQFSTASEAEYPLLLCCRFVGCIMPLCGLPSAPPTEAAVSKALACPRQSSRTRPLLSEYKQLVTCVHLEGLPAHKVLDTLHHKGNLGEAASFRVGVYRTPEEFLQAALEVKHPKAVTAIDDELAEIIINNLTKGPFEVAKLRLQSINMISKLKSELAAEEARFKLTLPPHAQRVLEGKSLLLWRTLLDKTSFPDKGVWDLMLGTDLTGLPTKSPLYGEKLKHAHTSHEELVVASKWRNQVLMSKPQHSADPAFRQALWDETLKERDRGFIQGPFDSLSAAAASLGFGEHEVCITRRFVIMQGVSQETGLPKPRVIDDAKESAINMAYTSREMLALHDLDYLSDVCSFIASILSQGMEFQHTWENGSTTTHKLHPSFVSRPSWKGRCLDLTKAYKQVPISRLSLQLGVLLVHNAATGLPAFFTSASMPFGCASSVYSFNRISRSLLHLKRHLLSLACGSYFDDFPYLESELLTGVASKSAEALLTSLGWLYANDAEKGKDFATSFSLLGVQLDLTSLHLGSFSLSNKPSRKVRLEEQLQEMVAGQGNARHIAKSVHGVLNFMNGASLGHRLKLPCRAFANLSSLHEDPSLAVLEKLREFTLASLEDLRPKVLGPMKVKTPVLIFTDGAYEDGRATWGAVIIDSHTHVAVVHHGDVPQALLDSWKSLGKEQVICQVESYAAVIVRHAYVDLMHNRYCLLFIDNDASRWSLIKATSSSGSMLALAQAFYLPEADKPSCTWIERIPSASNIADWPSRGKPERAARAIGGSSLGDLQPKDSLLGFLKHPKGIPHELLQSAS